MSRITEVPVYVHNSLPPLSDEMILEKSGLLETAVAQPQSPLFLHWQYSSGLEQEILRLQPGHRQAIGAEYAREMMAELAEKGLVTYALNADAVTVEKVTAEGVKRAITFYSSRGNAALNKLRVKHNIDKTSMIDHKHEHWSYYYNQAIADLLKESLKPKTAIKKVS